MPTYDYQCRSCGRTFEVIHSMQEDGPSTCEVCGGELRRVLYPTGIIFKGSGFYKTDSRSSGSASVAGGSRSSSPSPSGDGKAGGGSKDAPGGGGKKADGPKRSDSASGGTSSSSAAD